MKIQDQDGRAVRCIDCVKRKECKHLRINKYERKPCKEYVADLSKQARIVQQKINKSAKPQPGPVVVKKRED